MADIPKTKGNQTLEPEGSANPETPVESPTAAAENLAAVEEFSTGSWVRQVFTDAQGKKKIATTFVPDNTQESAEREIEDYDDENTGDWEQLLGDPPGIDIDEGFAILRLDDEAELATTTWLPENGTSKIVRNTLKQTPEQPGEPTANLRDFRNCFRNQAGLRRIERFRACRHLLHS